MSKTIDDLRAHLFQTLEALSDKAAPMDIARGKAISDVAQTIINTAKVEVDFARITGGNVSSFLPSLTPLASGSESAGATIGLSPDNSTARTAHGTKTVTQLPSGGTVTRHVMR